MTSLPRPKELLSILTNEESIDKSTPEVNFLKDTNKDGVWIREIDFNSRKIPTIIVEDEGMIQVNYKISRLKGFLLEPRYGTQKGNPVVAVHQHNMEYALGADEPAGLAGGPQMHYGLALAGKGFVVMAPDLLPFRSRFDVHVSNLPRGQEQLANQMANLEGHSYMGRHVLDLMAAVDAALEYSSAPKAGMIGHSLGGVTTLFAAACDSRIGAAVANCGLLSLESVVKKNILHNLALALPATFRREYGDLHTLLAMIAADRRYLIANSGKDDAAMPGVERIKRLSEKLYRQNVPERPFSHYVQFHEFNGGHEFPVDVQELSYSFLTEKLLNA